MVHRKNFIRLASMSVGALMVPRLLSAHSLAPPWFSGDGSHEAGLALTRVALNAARRKGASYADARIERNLQEGNNSNNIGIRVLVAGAWGFAATSELTTKAMEACAEKAVVNGAQKGSSSGTRQRHHYDPAIAPGLWRCECFGR